MTRLTLIKPDDWHVHLRDGEAMRAVLPDTAKRFARAIVMPNLNPPIVTTEMALAYRQHILNALPPTTRFEPLMTLYLTESTLPEELIQAKNSGMVHAVKLYPAGATTHSNAGVRDLTRCDRVFAAMQEIDLPLLIHGEVVDPNVDVFDRERVFVETQLYRLVERFPKLRIVLEHITTRFAVEFITRAPSNIAATITAHHLLCNRNEMFRGGIQPHFYCLPLLKREEDRLALIAAATGGNPKFFLGTDSAPHAKNRKETACGCAGIYSAHAALELYVEVFESHHALPALEAFASFYGADFYRLPRNTDTITLEKQAWRVPESLDYEGAQLVPLRAGEWVNWRIVA